MLYHGPLVGLCYSSVKLSSFTVVSLVLVSCQTFKFLYLMAFGNSRIFFFFFHLIMILILVFVVIVHRAPRHAHYQTGNTPLTLVWKDVNCSQYVIDTDNKGQVPSQQQVVLELLDDSRLATSDDPPVIFGCLLGEFIQKTELQRGDLIKFAIGECGLVFVDSKLEKADLQYLGKSNRARAFADSYSKVLFQYAARHSPLRIEHLFASISSCVEDGRSTQDADMAG